jgi:hypothetical protein
MRTRKYGFMACLTLALAGCVGDDSVVRNPFRKERQFDPSTTPQATTIIATRVVTVGKEVVAANDGAIDFKPVFFTSGVKESQIFHVQKQNLIVISEGLVQKCGSDDELAAVICYELGKLAAEHSERGPAGGADLPPAPIPSDVVGNGRSPDQTRQAEEALYGRRNGQQRGAREPRVDPRTLALSFYTKAGHKAEDFARMDSIIKEAEDNGDKREYLRGR